MKNIQCIFKIFFLNNGKEGGESNVTHSAFLIYIVLQPICAIAQYPISVGIYSRFFFSYTNFFTRSHDYALTISLWNFGSRFYNTCILYKVEGGKIAVGWKHTGTSTSLGSERFLQMFTDEGGTLAVVSSITQGGYSSTQTSGVFSSGRNFSSKHVAAFWKTCY